MTCSYDGCVNDAHAAGLCLAHRRQELKGQELRPLRAWVSRGPGCTVDGCTKPHHAKGLCRRHYVTSKPPTDVDGFCFTCDAVEVMHGRGDDFDVVCAAVGLRPSSLLRHVQRHPADLRIRAWAARGVKAHG